MYMYIMQRYHCRYAMPFCHDMKRFLFPLRPAPPSPLSKPLVSFAI
jgi:hypothetical protein